eukprot:CAMPEP_0197930434 /NCGR_PEP_ID=MMETSP1439-20131203/105449_1 /TAXON_ID=66791 /ORGANISM="Gonyaulax spinifera, Strain CCMP409" /LENGTH=79 /DNA_ID=CAMNT_0043553123 /DNA_START=147 /DNA_END=384 /DNA_ORIENTATION=-
MCAKPAPRQRPGVANPWTPAATPAARRALQLAGGVLLQRRAAHGTQGRHPVHDLPEHFAKAANSSRASLKSSQGKCVRA